MKLFSRIRNLAKEILFETKRVLGKDFYVGGFLVV
jgi:hypothetical protein